jgi:hypothetical protein
MQSKTSAKDFFLYLAVFIGLYVSSISFLIATFQIINKLFPLTGEYISGIDSTIRASLATLIIFFPAFIYVSYVTNKILISNPEKKDIWIRRWMIFLTLFVAGITIAVDLATLIYRFLGAEDLTTRFFLKVFFVLAVTITIFRFTLKDLKRVSFVISKKSKIYGGIISLIVLAIIVYGIVIIGSPMDQRAKNMDNNRVNDLRSIQNQIVYTHWQNKGDIPEYLSELNDPISGYVVPTDPETRADYEYAKLSNKGFRLCATFKTTSTTTNETVAKPTSYYYGEDSSNQNWQHNAEKTCFVRVIDPKLYPVNKK